jgi:hypothetical protein
MVRRFYSTSRQTQKMPQTAERDAECRFDGLVGPWIEAVGNDRYRISPLLSNAGSKALSEPQQTSVHTAMAFSFLKRRTLTPHEFGTALMHAFIAKSDRVLLGLVRVVLTLDRKVSMAISDVVFWFPAMALQPGQQLSSNPATDFMLRLAQFRIAVASRQTDKALLVMDRGLELLDGIDHEEQAKLSKIIAYSTFLSAIEVPIPPRRSINMLAELMEFEDGMSP